MEEVKKKKRVSPTYNGWSGEIRDLRGNRFYKIVRSGVLPPIDSCFICKSPHSNDSWNTYHAEEYGSTWDEYALGTKPLCPRCHGMLHMRFRFPNRFKRIKARLASGVLFDEKPLFKNLNAFFSAASRLKDIPHQDDVETPNEWVNNLSLSAYIGPPKIATSTLLGVEVPDPIIYGYDWTYMTGVIVRSTGLMEEVEWHYPDQEPEHIPEQHNLFEEPND